MQGAQGRNVAAFWRYVVRAMLGLAAAVLALAEAWAGEIQNIKSVNLNVHGKVSEHCALGAIGNMNFGDLTRPGLSAASRVQLSCNVPFQLQIQALHGGLANDQHPEGQGPYAGTLPYVVGVNIPVLKPQSDLVSRTFQSRDLLSGPTLSSGGGIALDGMQLSVSLGSPASEAGLLAGRYGETLVITVSPS